MKFIRIFPLTCLLLSAGAAVAYDAIQRIEFTDLKPDGFELRAALNAVGRDHAGNIYITFANYGEDGTGNADVALFKYNPETNERSFLGTFANFLASEGNLKEGEPIMKGHTEIVCLDNMLYFGTMSVHQPQTPPEQQLGGHLLAYDLEEERFIDMSAHFEDGFFVKNGGILNLTVMPGYPYVVAYIVPYGDLAFFNPQTREIVRWVDGEGVNSNLTRVVLPSHDGRLFYAWGWNRMYVYNFATNSARRTQYSFGGQPFWNGWAQSRDGSLNYISDPFANLYEIDTGTESIAQTGSFRTDDAREGNLKMNNLNMNRRETALYGIPQLNPMRVLRYDIQSAQFTELTELGIPYSHTVGGSNLKDDSGKMYFAVHDDSRTVDGYLLQVDVDWLEGYYAANQFFDNELTETSSRMLVSPWFHSFDPTVWPYIFHESHGWLYASVSTNHGIFWDFNLGWIHASSNTYPYIYSYNQATWLFLR